MKIAILGDLHGRVLLPFYFASRWQQEHGEKIDCMLCVGDVGVYRGLQNMEKTSQRFARKYPEELGFSKLFYNFDLRTMKISRNPVVDEVLQELDANLYFVPGNHEEHQFLGDIWYNYASSMVDPVAVDLDWRGISAGRYLDDEFNGYGRIFVLPEGFRVDMLSAIDEVTWMSQFSVAVRAVNGLENYTMPSAWRNDKYDKIDILISHETYKGRLNRLHPTGLLDNAGSKKLFEMIRKVAPQYHFFGHYHWYYPEVEEQTYSDVLTRSVGMNQVNFDHNSGVLLPGSFGVLHVNANDDMFFELVRDNWLQSLRFQDCLRFM